MVTLYTYLIVMIFFRVIKLLSFLLPFKYQKQYSWSECCFWDYIFLIYISFYACLTTILCSMVRMIAVIYL